MVHPSHSIEYPELIFGLAGPLGVDLDALSDSLTQSLRSVGYQSVNVKLTDEMKSYKVAVPGPISRAYHSQIAHKMDFATSLCGKLVGASSMALIAVKAIQRKRAEESGS